MTKFKIDPNSWFSGDGRTMIGNPEVDDYPEFAHVLTATKYKRAVARTIIEQFEIAGHFCDVLDSLWILLRHCAERGIPYSVEFRGTMSADADRKLRMGGRYEIRKTEIVLGALTNRQLKFMRLIYRCGIDVPQVSKFKDSEDFEVLMSHDFVRQLDKHYYLTEQGRDAYERECAFRKISLLGPTASLED